MNNESNTRKLLFDVAEDLDFMNVTDFDNEPDHHKFKNVGYPGRVVTFQRLDKSNIFEFCINENIGSAAGYIGFDDCTIIVDEPQPVLYYMDNLYKIEDILPYKKYRKFDK